MNQKIDQETRISFSESPLKEISDRFWSRVSKTESCWIWNGAKTGKGYGSIQHKGKAYPTHRVAWELTHGKVPDGMFCLHKCDVRDCVNPNHIFLGTYKDNAQDMVRKGRHKEQLKTHCPQGHPLSGANLYICPRNSRQCRACRKQSQLKRKVLAA